VQFSASPRPVPPRRLDQPGSRPLMSAFALLNQGHCPGAMVFDQRNLPTPRPPAGTFGRARHASTVFRAVAKSGCDRRVIQERPSASRCCRLPADRPSAFILHCNIAVAGRALTDHRRFQEFARNGRRAAATWSGNSSCTESLPPARRAVSTPGIWARASISARDLEGVSAP
jgi:hypothetical protein